MISNIRARKVLATVVLLVLAMYSLISMTIIAKAGTLRKTYDNIKIGLICIHDETFNYDNNFIQALKSVQEELGLSNDQVLIKTGIAESDACYNAAAELANAGCDIIIANSFGHESFMIYAAQEFPDVQFCHATGNKAQTAKLPNYHNAFASIHEGRFLTGVAAGMKLNEMIKKGKITSDEAVIGYIDAFGYAEDVSAMTAFFLGARYVCPSVIMKVRHTYAWFNPVIEQEAATVLIKKDKCVLISQYSDSVGYPKFIEFGEKGEEMIVNCSDVGAPRACEDNGVLNIAYNINTVSMYPNTALISSKIDWSVYYRLVIHAIADGKKIPTDYCGTLKEGAVKLYELNTAIAATGTQAKLDEVKAKLESGEIKVFDTKTFTVDGKELTTYMADVVDEGDFKPETEVIENGEFTESSKRSAPYFDIKYIDGIINMSNQTDPTYIINYDLNGGANANNPRTYSTTTSTITLKNPTRKGYNFKGWYSDSKFKTKVTQIKKGSTGDKKLYAKWEKATYTITYKLDNGKNNAKNPTTYTVASADITLKNPSRTDYNFVGWYSNSEFKTKVTKISKGSTGNKTLYAKWEKAYRITYKLNGGTNNSANPKSFTATTATITLKNPTRKGYTFKGWHADEKFKTTVAKIAKGTKVNKTLYAKWAKNTYTITYKLNSGKNNSQNPKTYTVTASTITLKNPIRKGYIFKGWYSDKRLAKKVTKIAKGSTGNKTLYAKWAKKE